MARSFSAGPSVDPAPAGVNDGTSASAPWPLAGWMLGSQGARDHECGKRSRRLRLLCVSAWAGVHERQAEVDAGDGVVRNAVGEVSAHLLPLRGRQRNRGRVARVLLLVPGPA